MPCIQTRAAATRPAWSRRKVRTRVLVCPLPTNRLSVTVTVAAASPQYSKGSPESVSRADIRSWSVRLYRSATQLC